MAAIDNCIDGSSMAWMMVATVLVLGMIPALGFFEAGLLRWRNTVSLLSQIFAGFAVNAMLWFVVGFSLVYGDSAGGVIGNPASYPLFTTISTPTMCFPGQSISGLVFATFEMMFACITPLLITGAYAERLRLREFLIINTAWEVLVYYPVAHWMWGFSGSGGWLFRRGALDFAGGIVIHITAGASAVIFALLFGPRKGLRRAAGSAHAVPPSNVPLVAVGGAMLWMGWFGFNAGSELNSSAITGAVVANTQIASVAAATVWLALDWWRGSVPSVLAIINGAIAGLAGVTPAAGFISVQAACVLGLVLGMASYCSVLLIRDRFHIDDALDVSSVHGVPGLVGALAIGFAASHSINPGVDDGLLLGGGGGLLGKQALACVVVLAYSVCVTGLIGWVMRPLVLSFNPQYGLDLADHNLAAHTDDHHLPGIPSETQPLLGNVNTAPAWDVSLRGVNSFDKAASADRRA